MSKYTPGPWSVDHNMNIMSQGRLVAFPGIAAGFPQKANAQLIAAAPELLEALRRVIDCCDIAECQTVPGSPGALKNARAAIAKAEGGAA